MIFKNEASIGKRYFLSLCARRTFISISFFLNHTNIMYFFIRQLSLMAAMVSIVSAATLAATGTFEIVSPTPQAIYVAGQILPVIYTVNSDIVAQKGKHSVL
jgi:hypothetical protein